MHYNYHLWEFQSYVSRTFMYKSPASNNIIYITITMYKIEQDYHLPGHCDSLFVSGT